MRDARENKLETFVEADVKETFQHLASVKGSNVASVLRDLVIAYCKDPKTMEKRVSKIKIEHLYKDAESS